MSTVIEDKGSFSKSILHLLKLIQSVNHLFSSDDANSILIEKLGDFGRYIFLYSFHLKFKEEENRSEKSTIQMRISFLFQFVTVFIAKMFEPFQTITFSYVHEEFNEILLDL